MSIDAYSNLAAIPRHESGLGTVEEKRGDSAMIEDDRKLYTSRIIKAGALLADTTTLFEHWDVLSLEWGAT